MALDTVVKKGLDLRKWQSNLMHCVFMIKTGVSEEKVGEEIAKSLTCYEIPGICERGCDCAIIAATKVSSQSS